MTPPARTDVGRVVRLDDLRDRVVGATTALFSHGPVPLEHTLDHAPDPGLLGPESVSWEVLGDTAAFVGGIRALLVQTAHPEVVAGVEEHSRYRADPLGRLTRTSVYVTETTYGARPEVEAAVAAVRRAHTPVRGRSERGEAYRAGDPALAAWVHNVLTESFLASYQAYGPRRLSTREADRFVAEQSRIGELLGADPLPRSAPELRRWVWHHGSLERSSAQASALRFLAAPPLPLPVRPGYRLLYLAATGTLPPELSRATGVTAPPGAAGIGRRSVRALRWALGSSPSWHLALVRCGAPVPSGIFRQPLPDRGERRAPAETIPAA